MHRLILLLVCIALPVQAWAAMARGGEVCSMTVDRSVATVAEALSVAEAETASETGLTASATEATADGSETDHDCCDSPADFAHDGRPCQCTQQCHAPVLWVMPMMPPSALVVHTPMLPAAEEPAVVFGLASLVWRPPALR